jgi:hypothetical protein
MQNLAGQLRNSGYPAMMTEVDNETAVGGFSAGWSLIQWLERQGFSWAWLDGDGFVDTAAGIAYGNLGGQLFPSTSRDPNTDCWPGPVALLSSIEGDPDSQARSREGAADPCQGSFAG